MNFQSTVQRLALASLTVVLLLPPLPANAQINVQVAIPVPTLDVQVGAPLVYVAPDVWVLPDSDDEVFYSGGWYWSRRDGYWFRSHGRQSGWVVVQEPRVPRRLIHMAPGQYRRYRSPGHPRMMAPRGWEAPRRSRMSARPAMMHEGERHRDPAPIRQMQAPARSPAPMMERGESRGHGRGHGGGHGRGRGKGGEGHGEKHGGKHGRD